MRPVLARHCEVNPSDKDVVGKGTSGDGQDMPTCIVTTVAHHSLGKPRAKKEAPGVK